MDAPTPTIDEGLKAYLTKVHTSLHWKHGELDAMELRHEPVSPVQGRLSPRPEPDDRQKAHILRRYDESLCYLTGYDYNPKWAHFDRDAYGTGRLCFEDGVSLLGTNRSQDRWLPEDSLQQEPVSVSAPTSTVHRGARIDAFFAMFARRQELTLLSGLAPTCIFVGQTFAEDIPLPGLRNPPRPKERRLTLHRYPRLCLSVVHQSETHGELCCIVIADHEPTLSTPEPAYYRGYLLASGKAVTKDVHNRTGWLEELIVAVNTQWGDIFRGPPRQIVNAEQPAVLQLLNVGEDHGTWSPACHGGDAEMMFRLGLLLESPDLTYAPWKNTQVSIGTLKRVLQSAPVKPGLALTADAWMKYTLMARVYPYVSLAQDDMLERMHYKPYDADIPLDPSEIRTFRKTVIPMQPTYWIEEDKARRIRKRSLARSATRKKQRQPPPAQRPLTVGINGGRNKTNLARAVRKGRRTKIQISKPRLSTEQTKEIRRAIRGPSKIQTFPEALNARFLAIRLAFEAVSRNDPLYITSGNVWSEEEAYAAAAVWRRAILESDQLWLPWRLGVDTLELLYANEAMDFWNAGKFSPREGGRILRAKWALRVEGMAPKQMVEYNRINKQHRRVQVPMFLDPSKWKVRERRGPIYTRLKAEDNRRRTDSLETVLKSRDKIVKPSLLLRVARGTSPPDKGVNYVDLQIMALAVATSLIRDDLLFFVPPRDLWSDRSTLVDDGMGQQFWNRLPLVWNEAGRREIKVSPDDVRLPGTEYIPLRDATIGSLASFALLAWEWGGQRGLSRYLDWLDFIADKLESTLDVPVSTVLMNRYPVLHELLTHAAPLDEIVGEEDEGDETVGEEDEGDETVEEEELPFDEDEPEEKDENVIKREPLVLPRVLAPPSPSKRETQLANLVRYVEILHGYAPGTMSERFQALADAFANNPQLPPSISINNGRLRPTIRGLRGFKPANSLGVYAGWTKEDLYDPSIADLKVTYLLSQPTRTMDASEPIEDAPRHWTRPVLEPASPPPAASPRRAKKNDTAIVRSRSPSPGTDLFRWLRSG